MIDPATAFWLAFYAGLGLAAAAVVLTLLMVVFVVVVAILSAVIEG